MAFERNFRVFRHAPAYFQFHKLGMNWSAATFKFEGRVAKGDATVPAPIALANAAAGSQGVSAVWDANYPHPQTGAVVGATIITVQIAKAAFEALPLPANPADDYLLYYDMKVTPSGSYERVWPYGMLAVAPGVTR